LERNDEDTKVVKIDYRDKIFIRELYKHQTISIKTKERKRVATIRKGVRQGCKLPTLLFNMYIEQAIKEFKFKKSIRKLR